MTNLNTADKVINNEKEQEYTLAPGYYQQDNSFYVFFLYDDISSFFCRKFSGIHR